MKLYYIFTAESGYDLSRINYFKFFGSVKSGYVIVKFDESHIEKIIDLYGDYLRRSTCFSYKYNGYIFFGSDGNIYRFSDSKLSKLKSRGFKIFASVLYLSFKRNRSYNKSVSNVLYCSKHFNDSTVIRRISLLRYKAYEYYCKEQNITFKYRLKKTSDADKPLLIYMAGGASVGSDNIKQMFECFKLLHRQLKFYDCNVMIPQQPCISYIKKPTSNEYYNAVMQLINRVCEEIQGDKTRIYIVGSSGGGCAVWEMVYRFPDYFACGIPVMGKLINDVNNDEIQFEHFLTTPLWVAHSADDDNVRIDSDDYCVEKLKEIGADIRYTRWEKYGHKMSSKFYRCEPWAEWMFKQVKQ